MAILHLVWDRTENFPKKQRAMYSVQWRWNEFESEGHQFFCGRVPLLFFDSKSTISRFGERFRGGQYSLVSFLFVVLLLTVPPPLPSHL